MAGESTDAEQMRSDARHSIEGPAQPTALTKQNVSASFFILAFFIFCPLRDQQNSSQNFWAGDDGIIMAAI